MDKALTIAIVIPCLNEKDGLTQLFARITAAAETWGSNWEVICVDDGSRDATWSLLEAQHKRDTRWRAVRFARNFGHQAAVSAGLYHAAGDAVVVIDADLQDPPEEIYRFIAKWREGYDVVYAIRQKRKEGFFKRAGYWVFYRLLDRLVSFEIPLDSGDFCLMDRRVVATLNSMPERNRFVRGLRAWSGFKQTGIAYERQARAAGEAKYTFRKLVGLALDGVLSFSIVPLRLASILGFAVASASALGILFTLAQRLFKGFFAQLGLAPVPGFATVVISILFLGGVQLLCLGILGEYMGRVYEEVKRRPPWTICDTAGVAPRAPMP